MEDCPQLVAKWQEKREGNEQMVIAEQKEEGTPKICVVTRGGVHTRGDASTSDVN